MNEHPDQSNQAVELLDAAETESAELDVRHDSVTIHECVYCGHWPCGCGG